MTVKTSRKCLKYLKRWCWSTKIVTGEYRTFWKVMPAGASASMVGHTSAEVVTALERHAKTDQPLDEPWSLWWDPVDDDGEPIVEFVVVPHAAISRAPTKMLSTISHVSTV